MNQILLASGQRGGFFVVVSLFLRMLICIFWLLGGKVGLAFVVLVFFCLGNFFVFDSGQQGWFGFCHFSKILTKPSTFLKELIWF